MRYEWDPTKDRINQSKHGDLIRGSGSSFYRPELVIIADRIDEQTENNDGTPSDAPPGILDRCSWSCMCTGRTLMAKKSSASSRREKLVVKTEADIRAYAKTAGFRKQVERLRAIPDSAIDYSDIPALTDEQWARAMRFRDRLRKVVVSVRLDPRVVNWLKAKGNGHLTRMNDILVNLMEHELEVAEKRTPQRRR